MSNISSLTLSEKTVGDWLEYWAEKTPDKEYIVYSDRDLRFTWDTFNMRVNNMAKGLIAIGGDPWQQRGHLGAERARLAHLSLRNGQDRCRGGDGEYQLPVGGDCFPYEGFGYAHALHDGWCERK